jgi:hypothetical protein
MNEKLHFSLRKLQLRNKSQSKEYFNKGKYILIFF